MTVFIDLPEDIIKFLLTEWLTIEQWVNIDTALCSVQLRVAYLLLLDGQHAVCTIKNSISFFDWVYLRAIMLTSIFLYEVVPSLLRSELVSKACLECCSDVTDLVNLLHNLTSLSCSNTNVTFDRLNSAILKQLRYLEVGRRSDSHDFYSSVSRHCRSLHTFKTHLHDQEALCSIIECNPLECVMLPFSQQVISSLTQCCTTTLKFVVLIGKLDFSSVACLIRQCKVLEQISVEGPLNCRWINSIKGFEANSDFNLGNTAGWSELVGVLTSLVALRLECDFGSLPNLTQLLSNCRTTLTDISLCSHVIDADYLDQVVAHNALRKLSLEIEYWNCFDKMRWGKNLESLVIGSTSCFITPSGIQRLIKSSPNLTYLAFLNCYCIVEDLRYVIPVIADHRSQLSNRPLDCEFRLIDGSTGSLMWLSHSQQGFRGNMWDIGLKAWCEEDLKQRRGAYESKAEHQV